MENPGIGIQAADDRSGLKADLVPGEAFRGEIVGVHQARAIERRSSEEIQR